MNLDIGLLQSLAKALLHGDRTKLFWLAKLIAIVFVFLIFFMPAQKNLSVVSSNINSVKMEIDALKQIITNMLSPQELLETQTRLEAFGKRFVDTSQVSGLLDVISKQADENHLHIVQIYSDSPQSAKDEQGRELEFDGKKMFWIPVNFRLEADYKNFGNFLKSLSASAPWEYVVESMQLQRTSQGDALQCDVTLNFIAK